MLVEVTGTSEKVLTLLGWDSRWKLLALEWIGALEFDDYRERCYVLYDNEHGRECLDIVEVSHDLSMKILRRREDDMNEQENENARLEAWLLQTESEEWKTMEELEAE